MTVFLPKRALSRILSLDDFERAAARFLPKPVFAYVSGGTEDTASLRDNRAAFAEIRLLPRILVDVRTRSAAHTLFGQTCKSPFGLAPMGMSALSAYRGDLVQMRAAARLGMPGIMSGSSLIRLEDVAAEAPGTWFQAYIPPTPERADALIERVVKAGYDTMVITVDTAVLASRENNIRAGFKAPLTPSLSLLWSGMMRPAWSVNVALKTLARHGMPHFENSEASRGVPIVSRHVERQTGGRDWLSWDAFRSFRDRWRGRLILKGLLHPDDVRRAREAGADGVILSNHGGRQLDGTPAAIRVLPQAVAAAGGMPVMVDGGFRRGTDVIKALALGAAFVWVGRPFNYAAAVAGEAGVEHAHGLLQAELLAGLALLGVNSPAELGRHHLICPGDAVPAAAAPETARPARRG